MANRVVWAAVLSGTVVGCLSATATAERVDLVVFEGSPFAGLDIWLDLVDRGSEVDFVFRNDSSIGSSVANVYIENVPVASDLSNPVIAVGEPGVSFTAGADPTRPPGSIDAIFSPWSGNLYSAQADTPKPNEGVNPAERLTITFDNGGSFSDMLAALRDGSGSFRVAAHVIDLPGGESVWISNVPAPAPLTLLGLAALAATRRRR